VSWGGAAALLILGACFVKSLWGPVANNSGAANLYAQQAHAFLRGHLAVDVPLFDSAPYQGRIYVPFPPLPAVLLMPVVSIFGLERTNGALLAAFLTLLNIAIAHRLLRRLGVVLVDRVWLLSAFFFGTGYWYLVVTSGSVWFWAQVVAVTCLLLAVAEAWDRGRGHWVGVGLAGAFLSRQMTILAGVALAWRLWTHPAFGLPAARRRNLAAFVAVTSAGVAIYLVFNYMRFGNPFDTGYGHIPLNEVFHERSIRHGLFSAAYIPFNLIYLLFQGFHVDFNSPVRLGGSMTPDPLGTSLLGASPFILLALFAAPAGGAVRAIWASVAAIAIIQLFYINNGASQINTQRFTMDFMPLLLVLIGMGMRREGERHRIGLWRGTMFYAVLLNVLVLVLLPVLGPAFSLLER
jgi:hypothetical protein